MIHLFSKEGARTYLARSDALRVVLLCVLWMAWTISCEIIRNHKKLLLISDVWRFVEGGRKNDPLLFGCLHHLGIHDYILSVLPPTWAINPTVAQNQMHDGNAGFAGQSELRSLSYLPYRFNVFLRNLWYIFSFFLVFLCCDLWSDCIEDSACRFSRADSGSIHSWWSYWVGWKSCGKMDGAVKNWFLHFPRKTKNEETVLHDIKHRITAIMWYVVMSTAFILREIIGSYEHSIQNDLWNCCEL